jgi:hypothetical protein
MTKKKNINFYKLAHEIAASKDLTHSEKLITAYLFTLFDRGHQFFATNGYLSNRLDVQKSVISPCLTKLEKLGWITIANRNGNKRRISMSNNPCVSGGFYRLYYGIAATKELTALEKVLISYVLSFTDNGKRFYAKNAYVEHVLDISKEGFNTARIKFEKFGWIKVKYPKSPRREIVIVEHPTVKLPSNIEEMVTVEVPLNLPLIDNKLPINDETMPLINDNNISNKINDKRKEIKEVITKVNNTEIYPSAFSSSNEISFNSSKIEEISSTKEASPEALGDDNDILSISSYMNEKGEIKPISTMITLNIISTEEKPSTESISNLDEVTTSINLEGEDAEELKAKFDVMDYLSPLQSIELRKYIMSISHHIGKNFSFEDATSEIKKADKETIDALLDMMKRSK